MQWTATFDESPEDRGKYALIIGEAVFAAGLAALGQKLAPRLRASRSVSLLRMHICTSSARHQGAT